MGTLLGGYRLSSGTQELSTAGPRELKARSVGLAYFLVTCGPSSCLFLQVPAALLPLVHMEENGSSTALSFHVPSFSRDGLESLVYDSKGEGMWLAQHGSVFFPGLVALVTEGVEWGCPLKWYTQGPRALSPLTPFVTSECPFSEQGACGACGPLKRLLLEFHDSILSHS